MFLVTHCHDKRKGRPSICLVCLVRFSAHVGSKRAALLSRGTNGRLWRAGLPLRMDYDAELFSATQTLLQLLAVLLSGCFASVDLRNRLARSPPLLRVPELVVAALLRSKSTLTVLHDLPLVKPEEQPPALLRLFSRLRSLTLLQTWSGLSMLRLAQQLPASVEELTLVLAAPSEEAPASLPLFNDLENLPSLRRLTFANYRTWELGSTDGEQGHRRPLRVPPSFQVCSVLCEASF